MMVVSVCGKNVLIDRETREMYFGFNSIKFRDDQQFEAAYELLMIVNRICEELVKRVEGELRKVSVEGRL
ncbi:MAG: hypothetical protein JHC26_01260 [Thermofilum sp.]|uniref:hypothetical protein n=1 Tax=Thermofilum sp. TaxID=1961369 RepID=UPI002590A801|nr:hypothetical protein [Thermofilum sp.]MCI4407688.1 hypothetical protein [Thermofilum sp.]